MDGPGFALAFLVAEGGGLATSTEEETARLATVLADALGGLLHGCGRGDGGGNRGRCGGLGTLEGGTANGAVHSVTLDRDAAVLQLLSQLVHVAHQGADAATVPLNLIVTVRLGLRNLRLQLVNALRVAVLKVLDTVLDRVDEAGHIADLRHLSVQGVELRRELLHARLVEAVHAVLHAGEALHTREQVGVVAQAVELL